MADGALAERVRGVVGELAETIAAADVTPRDAGSVALWWAYAGDRYGSDARREQAVDRLCEALDEVDGMALHGGVVGLAWALAHIADDSAEELLGQFDELVVASLADVREFDLIAGLAGVGLYFLERPASDLRELALARIAEALADQPWRAGDEPVNCGLSHGVPGVIALLSRIDHPLAGELARWTLAQRLPGGNMPSFAGGTAARTAWCYGDPGVALALARTTPDDARALALLAAARDPEHTGAKDAALCHGAFGLAHVFARWHQATNEPAFAAAARAWLERGLDMPRPTGTSLLEGAPGVALALVAQVGGDEPMWDRILACDPGDP